MNWLQVEIDLGRLDPEPVVAALESLAAIAIEYHDAGNEAILEPAPGTTPLWRELRLSALLDADTQTDQVQLAVAIAVSPAPLPAIRFIEIVERDWVGEFNASLKARRYGSQLWVCPVGSDCPEPGATSIYLDPGLAFGSGQHPTTALCLEWLADQPPQASVLDFGCGSGILSIAAVALGASHATGIDNDPQALAATTANAAANGLGKQVSTCLAEALPADARYQLVVANILSGTLIELAAEIAGRCQPGAPFALSGILTHQASDVRDAYAPWIRFNADRERDDWVLLSGTARD